MSALVEQSSSAPPRLADQPVAREAGVARGWASLSVVEDIAALAEDRAGGRNFLKAYGHLELVR